MFDLYEESRNAALWLPAKGDWLKSDWKQPRASVKFTLPKGAVIKVDRIFIRKGSSDFDSISFYLDRSTLLKYDTKYSNLIAKIAKVTGVCRFWVKLADANKIKYECDSETKEIIQDEAGIPLKEHLKVFDDALAEINSLKRDLIGHTIVSKNELFYN